MFRSIRRKKNQISDEEAKKLLINEKRGIFAVNGDDGYPFAVPVNYYYDLENNRIYFHGAKSGHKVDSLRKSDKVCFTVYGNEMFKEDDWAAYVESVVVFGRCKLIEDVGMTEERIRELAMKYYPNADEVEMEIAKDIKAAQLYEITVEHICGKRIHER